MTKPTTSTESSDRTPVLACIADDVTGATDLAINLVEGGMRVIQLLGVPDGDLVAQTRGYDAVVVALKVRSTPKSHAVAESVAAIRALKSLDSGGNLRFYFKYCSTFDSTDEGNIGPISEALMDELGVKQTIFCPAFPRAGRTVYHGHCFVGDVLLSESGMATHPLTPMTDSSLVRCLAKQSTRSVGLFSHGMHVECADDAEGGSRGQAYATRFRKFAAEGCSLLITDVCDDGQLCNLAYGVASTDEMRLVTGGSGLGRFLPEAFRCNGLLMSSEYVPRLPDVQGRSLIVAGSCSPATNRQVEWMKSRCPSWPIDVAAVVNDAAGSFENVRDWAISTWTSTSRGGPPLLVYSTAAPDQVQQWQAQFGTEAVAAALENFSGKVARLGVELGVRRLVLAGGETSGAVVNELGVQSMSIGSQICTGVPWTETTIDGQRLALALKSGNFGEDDFFETALGMLRESSV